MRLEVRREQLRGRFNESIATISFRAGLRLVDRRLDQDRAAADLREMVDHGQ